MKLQTAERIRQLHRDLDSLGLNEQERAIAEGWIITAASDEYADKLVGRPTLICAIPAVRDLLDRADANAAYLEGGPKAKNECVRKQRVSAAVCKAWSVSHEAARWSPYKPEGR